MSGATSTEQVGVRELKNHLSSYLDKVKQGDELLITEHGKPIARIVAVDSVTDLRAKLIEEGVIRPATAKRKLPSKTIKLKGDGPSISEMVIEQRR
ncbi:MAG: type II toxin-antitoxin system Phd/YefM family antitoxin [Acidimicrobiia bacterium]